MIAQLLNRRFILEQLQDLGSQLQRDVQGNRRGGEKGAEDLEAEDYQEALALIELTEQSETRASSGQPNFEPPSSERRGGGQAAPLDDFSFLSRDPVINILQSALEKYFEEHQGSNEERVDITDLIDDRRGPGEDVIVTDESLPGVQPVRHSDGRRLFNKFSITDAGWVSCWVAEGIRKFRHKHSFNSSPTSMEIAQRTRFVIVGDWGSGLPRARKVAEQMRKAIDEGKSQNREVHVIHLGDVYYSGWKGEYEKRFLRYWPVEADEIEGVYSWSLNANHDMYSGGHDYYDTLLADARFKKQNRCSYFELYNADWRIMGLDTGWDEGDLKDPQPQWLQERIDNSRKKVMLLSHHQLFSAYESASDKIGKKLRGVLETDLIRSWFWGHEHRCMLYKPYQHVEYARCIGDGGVPVYMSHGLEDPYPEPGEYESRGSITRGIERWALMGFAILDFDGPFVHAQYVNEYGNLHKQETFS